VVESEGSDFIEVVPGYFFGDACGVQFKIRDFYQAVVGDGPSSKPKITLSTVNADLKKPSKPFVA